MSINWQPIVKSKASVLFQWLVFKGHQKKYFQNSLEIEAHLDYGKIVSDEIFINLNEWTQFEKVFSQEIKKSKKFYKKFVKNCYRYGENLLQVSKKLGRTKSPQPKQHLKQLYLEYQKAVLDLIPFMNAVLAMDNILNKQIRKNLTTELKIANKKEQDLLLSKLIIPKKKSYFVQENEAILKMALKLNENKNCELDEEIKDYLEKFAWMPSTAYLGPFTNKNKVLEKVKKLLNEKIKKKIKKTKQIKKEALKNYKKAYQKIERSQETIELIDLAREFIFLQTYRLDIFFKAHYYVFPLLEKVAACLNLNVKELVYLTGDEITKSLQSGLVVTKKEIGQRIKDYALIFKQGRFLLSSNNQTRKGKEGAKSIKNAVVKGDIANRGRATGRVKIIKSNQDMKKVNKGDLIVSPMTHPKLIEAITKSSGIITDFGGMLCHAAIISREFGIPCLIGTKTATRIFQDDDLVELNAYDGIARKLEHNCYDH